jgi:hypothetical protein
VNATNEKAAEPEGVCGVSTNLADMRMLGFVVNLLAGLTCVGAGSYLLAQTSETGPTWLEVIAHGSGAFFIGCGLYMIGSAIRTASDR